MKNDGQNMGRKVDFPHNLILEGRERMSVSGVEDVESFDETAVVMITTRGVLTVRGEQLHIEKLSLDNGEVSLEGKIDLMEYEDGERTKAGFFAKLFG